MPLAEEITEIPMLLHLQEIIQRRVMFLAFTQMVLHQESPQLLQIIHYQQV
jgi:hypothetical protein